MSDVVLHEEEHAHHPFLQHHFEDLGQQHEASTLEQPTRLSGRDVELQEPERDVRVERVNERDPRNPCSLGSAQRERLHVVDHGDVGRLPARLCNDVVAEPFSPCAFGAIRAKGQAGVRDAVSEKRPLTPEKDELELARAGAKNIAI